MPEMIGRSSSRSGPGWSRGMNGALAAHRASESQNGSAIAASALQTAAAGQKTTGLARLWSGLYPRVKAAPMRC